MRTFRRQGMIRRTPAAADAVHWAALPEIQIDGTKDMIMKRRTGILGKKGLLMLSILAIGVIATLV
ncbi:MAG: hypothetical protein WA077_21960, partial [Anaerolineae bacterium]